MNETDDQSHRVVNTGRVMCGQFTSLDQSRQSFLVKQLPYSGMAEASTAILPSSEDACVYLNPPPLMYQTKQTASCVSNVNY